MKEPSRRVVGRRRIAVGAALLVLLAALVFAGAALTFVGAAPVLANTDPLPSPTPSPSPSATPVIACAINDATAVYGQDLTVHGTVTPAPAAGQEVDIVAAGAVVKTAATDAAGLFSAQFVARGGGAVVAQMTAAPGPISSAPITLVVCPRVVSLKVAKAYPFLPTNCTLHLAPHNYKGFVSVRVVHRGRLVATLKRRCKNGAVKLAVPTPGIGSFSLAFVTQPVASMGLSAAKTHVTFKVSWQNVAVGSKGPYARGLLLRLAALKIHIPGLAWSISSDAGDAIVAFQKAYRLPRTYVVNYDDWCKLDSATVIKPHSKAKGTHIEIEKGRQILMVVHDGKLVGLIAVSTGRTGNTPVGKFKIYNKSPATTSAYGSGLLWRTMGFYGNFAIHGYVPVPPYPASHGCVREPWWAANWTYTHSFVGEGVFIYY